MIDRPIRGETPWERLAWIARNLLVETLLVEGQVPGTKAPYPYIPDIADFAAGIKLQYELEAIAERLDEHNHIYDPDRVGELKRWASGIRRQMNYDPPR